MWETGEPLWVQDVAADSPGRPCAGEDVHTVLAVPLRDSGTVLGVLAGYAATVEDDQEILTVLLGGVASQLGR